MVETNLKYKTNYFSSDIRRVKMTITKYIILIKTARSGLLYLPETKQTYHRLRTTAYGPIHRCIVRGCKHLVYLKNLTCFDPYPEMEHNHIKTNEEKALENVKRILMIQTMLNEYPEVKKGCRAIRKVLGEKRYVMENYTVHKTRATHHQLPLWKSTRQTRVPATTRNSATSGIYI